jgi:hypothetical protein
MSDILCGLLSEPIPITHTSSPTAVRLTIRGDFFLNSDLRIIIGKLSRDEIPADGCRLSSLRLVGMEAMFIGSADELLIPRRYVLNESPLASLFA